MSGNKSRVNAVPLSESNTQRGGLDRDEVARYWNVSLTASHFNLTVPQFLKSKWFRRLAFVRLGENWTYYLWRDVTKLPQTPFDVKLEIPIFSEKSQQKFGPLVLLNSKALADYHQISMEEVAEMFEHAPFFLLGNDKLYDARIMKTFSRAWQEARERSKQGALASHFVN
jgi:hypothetical protein